MIVVENLSKTFKKEEKEKGLRGSLKSLFSPNIKEVKSGRWYQLFSGRRTNTWFYRTEWSW